MAEGIYEVVVLGGGAGGAPAAIRAAQLKGRVAIIECENLGGQCMNKGCIPFGHMMVASNILRSLSLGKEMGLTFNGISKDYTILKKRQDELISFMREGVRGTLRKNGVEIFEGRGRIVEKGKLAVNGKIISYKNIILATGAQWMRPGFEGGDLAEVVNSDYLLNTEKIPKKALLFGRSPWLIEIAQFLNRFGSQAIIATQDETILSGETKTITSRLRKVIKNEGIVIKTKAEIVSVSKKRDGLHVDLSSKDGGETFVVDRIITLERGASLKDLGLKKINIKEDSQYLKVNNKMETGIEGVYAIGDLTEPQPSHYSHLAFQKGITAAENAMGKDAAINPRTFTRILFTQPEVACVGLTPKEAKNAGHDVVVGAAPFGMNPYGMILSEDEGIVEVVAEKKYGEILGVHFIGTAASEMVGQAVLAIQTEVTIDELSRVPFPHPTLSESLAEAAADALGKPIYLP